MNYQAITNIYKSRKYSIEDFKLSNVEEIKELEYDFDYFKREFGDKFDDEMLALFELIENSDLSKKEVKLMTMMLKKMYHDKYKETVEMFHLKPEDVKPEDLRGEFKQNNHNENSECIIEEIEEVKKPRIERVKQLEFNESNYIGFDEIVKKMEELELNE